MPAYRGPTFGGVHLPGALTPAPAGGQLPATVDDQKKATAEGTQKGVFEGLRDWFEGVVTGGNVGAHGGEGGLTAAMRSGGGSGPAMLGAGGEQARTNAAIIAEEFRAAGMSPAGIAGILGEVQSESGFNAGSRHFDQPTYAGTEAGFAHGLYQEGGDEWNRYSAWLRSEHPGADWRDPRLQTQFLIMNLKTRYPGVWSSLMGAATGTAGAEAFRHGYLKPASAFMNRGTSAEWWARHLPEPGHTPLDLLQRGKQSGLLGGPGKVEGDASLTIDLNGFPRGTRTKFDYNGIFSGLTLNRGPAMPMANQEQ